MGPISFPNLGIEINPSRVAFSLFGKEIYWYGIIIAVGFILAVIYGMSRAAEFGLNGDIILDMLFVAVPASVICARVYYCIFEWNSYKDNPISILYIWEGGIAIYGAVIGAVISVLIFCRIKHLPFLPLADIGGLGLLIGQLVGRWGNFINREAFGAETDSFLKMGLAYANGGMKYYHPTFLYESLWNLVGFILLHFLSKKRKFDGQVFAGYVAWYGLGRAWIEGLRTDSLYLLGTGIRVSQLLAAVSFVLAAAWIIYVLKVKKPDGSALFVNKQSAEEADAQEI